MDDPIEAAYRREHVRLWRSLVGYCGDRDLASDAEAEAWAQAVRRGSELNNPAAWVWTAAFKIAAGLLVDKKKRQAVTLIEADASVAGLAPLGVDDDRGLTELFDVLGTLSDQQRACIVLRYVGRMKPGEVADVLGTTSASVRVQLHRAHTRLQAELETVGDQI